MLVGDKNDNNANKNIREHTEKTKELLDKLVNEIRKDLNLPEIEKSLAETFSPKEPPDRKAPKR